jgi:hypothetical protein
MGNVKVVDLDGEWVHNPRAFPFSDPETKVQYAPSWFYKVKVQAGSWIAGQVEAGVLVRAPDPTAGPPKVAPPKTPPGKPGAAGKAEG